MGKPKAASAFSKDMTSHYGVALNVTAKDTKGSTAAFAINGTQAVAGVSYDKSQFNPITPFFWVGLSHEQVRIVNDRVAPTRVTIGF